MREIEIFQLFTQIRKVEENLNGGNLSISTFFSRLRDYFEVFSFALKVWNRQKILKQVLSWNDVSANWTINLTIAWLRSGATTWKFSTLMSFLKVSWKFPKIQFLVNWLNFEFSVVNFTDNWYWKGISVKLNKIWG